ncbi:MAG: HD domain-containing protein, partial [Lachnospiraceae bacterium]|nr:HD domain-containing protein [Lachnospiraceae bacterium]
STGVTKYTEGYFYNTNLNSGLEDTALNAITKANDMYFIGSDDRLYICDSNWNQITNELTDMLEGVRVRHVITDSKGTVWLATYAGVYNYNPKTEKIVSYTTENGLINDRARVLLELQDGNIAVGTQAGISFIGNNKVLENYDHEDGLVNPAILCMLQAEDGTLLCGSDGDGIYAIKEHTITNHGFNEGLAEGVVLRMIKNKDEAGYFISAGSSLYYWNDVENTFTKLTNWDKGAGSVFDMYDKNGYIWILQNKGVLAVNKEQLIHDIPAETITYSFTHGLTGSLNANTWNYLEDDENLYMVTRNGVCIFYFTEIKNSDPKGIISSVIVDDVMYDNPTKLHLKSNANRITINFSELSFSGTSTLKMSYILEGFDTKKTMVATEHSQSISYTNLPGGDYTFILDIYDSHNPNVKERYTVEIHKDKKFTEYQLFWIILVLIMLLVTGLIIYYISRRKIRKLQQHKKEYQDILDQSLKTFAKTIDAKDTYTNGHSLRVAMYSRELAKRLGLSEWEQERIYYVAMLHDIGKIGIPDNILNKPGKLTEEEMRIIQTHPAIGGEILKDFTALPNISEGAKYHHERYDGKGYCEGKAGEDIPFVARIIGVADTYDAMSSDRCYRKALSTDIIISELKKGIGTQLDPDIVKIMLEMIEEGSVPYTI